MPTPRKNETEDDFVSRCIPIVLDDQDLDKDDEGDRKQAAAICHSMWREDKKEKAATGQGVGVGGDRQGTSGTDVCRCPECGYETEHERGTPCSEMTCPECGATLTGVEGKDQDTRYPSEDEELEFVVHLLGKENSAKGFVLYEYRNDGNNYLNGYELQAMRKDAEVDISSEDDLETVLHSKDLWTLDWDTGEPNSEANELGDERPGVVYVIPKTSEIPVSMLTEPVQGDGEYVGVVDQGVVEWGAQLPDYKEFFLHGDRFHGRYIFRSIGRQASREYGWSMEEFGEGVQGEVRKDTSWVMEKPADQTPYVLGKEAVESNWLPPSGVSALPRSVRDGLSDGDKFWNLEHREALEARNRVASSEPADSSQEEKEHDPNFSIVEGAWDRFRRTVSRWSVGESAGSLFITKQQDDGRWRWVAISSTAFLDREEEIVSREGISKSIARADDTKSYGPLLFWHEPGIVLGECDFQAQHDLCLIESGLWRDDEVGEAARKSVDDSPGYWGISIGFLPLAGSSHEVVNGRIVNVVWKDLQIAERSTLPSSQAATWYSSITNKSTEDVMDERKKKQLASLLGEDLALQVLADAEEVNKNATPDAVFKDTEPNMVKSVLSGVMQLFGIKERGLEAQAQDVRMAFSSRFGRGTGVAEPGYKYVIEVFPDHIISEEDDGLFKYPYTKSNDEYEFGDPVPVEIQYVEKAASGSTSLPLASRDREWDASAAEKRVRSWADAEDEPNAKYTRAFFYKDTENADKFGGYKLPFADVIDGVLTAIPKGIFAVTQRLEGTDIPDDDKSSVRSKVNTYYRKMQDEFDDDSIVPPWEKEKDTDMKTKDQEQEREEQEREDQDLEAKDEAETEPSEDETRESDTELAAVLKALGDKIDSLEVEIREVKDRNAPRGVLQRPTVKTTDAGDEEDLETSQNETPKVVKEISKRIMAGVK